jgi:hypothetical protein
MKPTVCNKIFEGITVLETLVQLDERLLPQYFSILYAVFNPSVDCLVVDILERLNVGTIG